MKFAFSHYTAILSVGTCLSLPFLPIMSAQSQTAFTLKNVNKWQTITDKEVGISVLMPPGTEVTPKTQTDPASGAKFVLLQAASVTNNSKYVVAAFRVNDAALDQLRKKHPGDRDPFDMFYQTVMKPDMDKMIKDAQKDPTLGSISRKPITWHGLQGEEVVTKANIEKSDKLGDNGLLRLRMVRNHDSLLLVAAAEKKQSIEGEQRIERFFQSLTLLPEFSTKL